jgi:hypothetical protein
MDTAPVSLASAAEIEEAEARSWADLYAAAPADFAREAGLTTRKVGGSLALSWAATGRRYLSRAIGLGVVEPATFAQLTRSSPAGATPGSPEQIENFPVQASFVDGQLRDGMGSGWPGRGLDQTSAPDP